MSVSQKIIPVNFPEETITDVKHNYPVLRTAVVHPVKSYVIESMQDAVNDSLIEPVLIGPEAKIKIAADEAGIDISSYEIIETEHSHEAATKAAELAGDGDVDIILKGSIHSSELLSSVIKQKKLHTERRLSHVYTMEVKTYHKPFFVTDAAINITPNLKEKVDIIQNAVNLWLAINHEQNRKPKVAILAAVETVNPDMQATIDAACLCKMSDRGQIQNAIIDGPLAFDNAISMEAAKQKGIISEVAGDPDILVAPNLEAGNILSKQLTFISEAEAAGIVLGARVPIILTSRADSQHTRLLSCALAVKLSHARKEGIIK